MVNGIGIARQYNAAGFKSLGAEIVCRKNHNIAKLLNCVAFAIQSHRLEKLCCIFWAGHCVQTAVFIYKTKPVVQSHMLQQKRIAFFRTETQTQGDKGSLSAFASGLKPGESRILQQSVEAADCFYVCIKIQTAVGIYDP